MVNASVSAMAHLDLQVSVRIDELFQVICNAASQDPAKMKASTDRLKALLEMPGCFDALSEIADKRDVPLEVRQQSIIQLKNAVGQHWRSRRFAELLWRLLFSAQHIISEQIGTAGSSQ